MSKETTKRLKHLQNMADNNQPIKDPKTGQFWTSFNIHQAFVHSTPIPAFISRLFLELIKDLSDKLNIEPIIQEEI